MCAGGLHDFGFGTRFDWFSHFLNCLRLNCFRGAVQVPFYRRSGMNEFEVCLCFACLFLCLLVRVGRVVDGGFCMSSVHPPPQNTHPLTVFCLYLCALCAWRGQSLVAFAFDFAPFAQFHSDSHRRIRASAACAAERATELRPRSRVGVRCSNKTSLLFDDGPRGGHAIRRRIEGVSGLRRYLR